MGGIRVSMGNFDLTSREQINGSWQTVCSDRQGRFVFKGVAPGGHRLVLDRFENAGKAESGLFKVSAGGNVTMDLTLKK
jgi:hypothetical protein